MQLLFFLLALTFYYILHSILANNKVKAYLMGRFIAKKYYRLLFNLTAILLLLPIYGLYRNTPTRFIFENIILKYTGLGIAGIGIFSLVYALSQYNLSAFSGLQEWRQHTLPTPESLKTTGFNALVRHPLYFSGLLIIWGGFLFRPTDVYLVMAVVSTAYLYFGTKLEEEKLVEEFGSAYLAYQKRVGMILPFIR